MEFETDYWKLLQDEIEIEKHLEKLYLDWLDSSLKKIEYLLSQSIHS